MSKPFIEEYSAGGYLPDYGYYEQIEKNRFAFLKDATSQGILDNTILFSKQFEVEDQETGKPKLILPLKRCPWPLVKEPIPYTNFEDELWFPINKYIYEHLDLTEYLQYSILTSWTIATWLQEKWQVIPYIFFYGELETGKTRGLETLQQLCYRAIITADISEAALFRAAEKYHPTFFIDETEILSQESRIAILGLLNAGYRRGQYAMRVKNKESGDPDIEFFDVFGFRALAGTDSLRATLHSRSLEIKMATATRKINFTVDGETAQELRGKLLYHRLKTLNEKQGEQSEGSEGNPQGIPDPLTFMTGRSAELFHCLYQVAQTQTFPIIEYARLFHTHKQEERSASIEAIIVEHLVEMKNEVESGRFSTRDLGKKFNLMLPEREQWKTSSIGRIVSRLGFQKTRLHGGVSGYIWNQDLVDRLSLKYGVETTLGKGSKPSLPSPEIGEACYYCGEVLHAGEGLKLVYDKGEYRRAHSVCDPK